MFSQGEFEPLDTAMPCSIEDTFFFILRYAPSYAHEVAMLTAYSVTRMGGQGRHHCPYYINHMPNPISRAFLPGNSSMCSCAEARRWRD